MISVEWRDSDDGCRDPPLRCDGGSPRGAGRGCRKGYQHHAVAPSTHQRTLRFVRQRDWACGGWRIIMPDLLACFGIGDHDARRIGPCQQRSSPGRRGYRPPSSVENRVRRGEPTSATDCNSAFRRPNCVQFITPLRVCGVNAYRGNWARSLDVHAASSAARVPASRYRCEHLAGSARKRRARGNDSAARSVEPGDDVPRRSSHARTSGERSAVAHAEHTAAAAARSASVE